ncbi:MAG: hypothetical protein LLG03_16575 [Planctomycetaceae bacterium]|nr:hypothetical protein [Planctomycetaceae bacterium]
MKLLLPTEAAEQYRSNSQKARIITETWAANNVYCAECSSVSLSPAQANTPAIDFICPVCRAQYQLKSTARPIGSRVMDAGYDAMLRAIRTDGLPNFLILSYSGNLVQELLLIPRFSLSPTAIQPRPPLSSGARRAGWVGCNILLEQVPSLARILIVESGHCILPERVRAKFKSVAGLAQLRPTCRGWTLDVLAALRSLNRRVFRLEDVYGLEPQLATLHPNNNHIRPKIRQQLQILRDLNLLRFMGGGHYELFEDQGTTYIA